MELKIDRTTGKKRRRRVCQDWQIRNALLNAGENNGISIIVEHGGSVSNSYAYPASTEVCGTVVIQHNSQDYIYSVKSTIPANKVTISGACKETLSIRVFDHRLSKETKDKLKSKLLCEIASELGCWE